MLNFMFILPHYKKSDMTNIVQRHFYDKIYQRKPVKICLSDMEVIMIKTYSFVR